MYVYIYIHILVLDTWEARFLSGFVPILDPLSGANRERVLSVHLALFVVSAGLLEADEPLVVTIPAVEGLVLGGETLVTGSGSSVLDLVQQVFLLLRKVWDLISENLAQLHFYLNTEERRNL